MGGGKFRVLGFDAGFQMWVVAGLWVVMDLMLIG